MRRDSSHTAPVIMGLASPGPKKGDLQKTGLAGPAETWPLWACRIRGCPLSLSHMAAQMRPRWKATGPELHPLSQGRVAGAAQKKCMQVRACSFGGEAGAPDPHSLPLPTT